MAINSVFWLFLTLSIVCAFIVPGVLSYFKQNLFSNGVQRQDMQEFCPKVKPQRVQLHLNSARFLSTAKYVFRCKWKRTRENIRVKDTRNEFHNFSHLHRWKLSETLKSTVWWDFGILFSIMHRLKKLPNMRAWSAISPWTRKMFRCSACALKITPNRIDRNST